MAKTYILGIGGTGSRILQSLVVLLSAGANCRDEIVPIILDLDTRNGDTDEAFKIMSAYNGIRNRIFGNKDNNFGLKFFNTKISNYRNTNTISCIHNPNIRFSQFIGYADERNESIMNGDLSETSLFIDSIFDNKRPENEDTDVLELYLKLDKGFKGRPNIGSVVFDRLKDVDEFKDLLRSINTNPDDKIFIISSIFGGTGSSGFPQILKILENAHEPVERQGLNLANMPRIAIGALSVFPYFNLQTPSANKDMSIVSDEFMNKSKSALYYYKDNMKRLDRMYNLYDDRMSMYVNESGGNEQENDVHWIEMIGAYAILDFINNCRGRNRNTQNEYIQETYAYFSKYENDKNADFNVLNNISFGNFYQKSQNEILIPLLKLAILSFLIDKTIPSKTTEEFYIDDAKLNLRNRSSNECKLMYIDSNNTDFVTLHIYLNRYINTWFSEMQNNSRSLKLVDLDTEELNHLLLHRGQLNIAELKNENIQRLVNAACNNLPQGLSAEVKIMKILETSVESIYTKF